MLQRKGIFKPIHIKHVNEQEAIRFEIYAKKHFDTIKKIWQPISDC